MKRTRLRSAGENAATVYAVLDAARVATNDAGQFSEHELKSVLNLLDIARDGLTAAIEKRRKERYAAGGNQSVAA